MSEHSDINSLNKRNEEAIRSAAATTKAHIDALSVLTTDDDTEQTVANVVYQIQHRGQGDDNATVDNDGDEHLTCHTQMTSSTILADEQKLIAFLAALNDIRSAILYRDIKVGGNIARYQTFHYPAMNAEARRNKKQWTYINPDDLPLLFSYEFKAALMVSVQLANSKKFVGRAFLSYCQLEFNPDSPDDHRYEKQQMILVGILTTLCDC